MDAFDFDSNHKIENRVILIFHSFKNVAKLFRIVEICIGALVLLWSSTRLPFVIKLSGEYFRQLITIMLSPLFIFLISNFIVLTLLFKSGRLSGTGETDLYESFVEKEEYSPNLSGKTSSPVPEQEADIVYQDKQTIFEVNNRKISESEALCTKVPRRTKSEKLEKGSAKEVYSRLRRSETEKCRNIENPGEFPSETVDELSNEEFQKAIEDFIARQIKFHQEEKLAIVLHSQV